MIFISKIFLQSVFLLLLILSSFNVVAQDNKRAVVKLGIVDLAEVTRKSFMSKDICLLYTSSRPRDLSTSRMPSSA